MRAMMLDPGLRSCHAFKPARPHSRDGLGSLSAFPRGRPQAVGTPRGTALLGLAGPPRVGPGASARGHPRRWALAAKFRSYAGKAGDEDDLDLDLDLDDDNDEPEDDGDEDDVDILFGGGIPDELEDDDDDEDEDEDDKPRKKRAKPVGGLLDSDDDEDEEDEEDDDEDDEGTMDLMDQVAEAEDEDEEGSMTGSAQRRGLADINDSLDDVESGTVSSIRGSASSQLSAFTGGKGAIESEKPDLDLDAFLEAQGMPQDMSDGMVTSTLAELGGAGGAEPDDLDEWVESWPTPPDRSYGLGELLDLAGLSHSLSADAAGVVISGIASDSRLVRPGDLFVCIPGATSDGHDFVEAAVEAGAAAVLATTGREGLQSLKVPVVYCPDTPLGLGAVAKAFYEDPSSRLLTVGITGTNGKTTTSWLVRGILEEAEHLTGMIGTIEYALCNQLLSESGELWKDTPAGKERDIQEIIQEEWDKIHVETNAEQDGRRRLLAHANPYHIDKYQGRYSMPNTTPSALQMQQLLASMADRGGSAAVMECSSIGLDQDRVAHVDFDVAVFMNLSHDHLDYHGTMDEYLAAKCKLFEALDDPGRQRAVVNVDDVRADTIKTAASRVPIVTFAVNDKTADVTVETMGMTTLSETDITISTPLGSFQVITPMIGLQNVYNLLAATAVGISINIPLETIAAGLEAVDIVPGRMEKVEEGQAFTVIVDYAHTPDALEYCLNTVRSIGGVRRVILVFGCGGDRDTAKRKYMMDVADQKADIVIVTTDNPRSEDPQDIFDDMSYGLPAAWDVQPMENGDYTWFADPSTCVPWENGIIWDMQLNYKRYVVEDRHFAIRSALSIAEEKDVVVIAGKGHEDYQEWLIDGKMVKSWFSDQQEVRSAVNVLGGLYKVPINRKNLPWEPY